MMIEILENTTEKNPYNKRGTKVFLIIKMT